MRIKSTLQRSIFDQFAKHELGKELFAISEILDEHPEMLEHAAQDLIRVDVKQTGRSGLTVEQIIRCALLKQHRQLTYEELAFYLEDSKSFQAFARLNGKRPKKSVLQKTISLIKAETWERINHIVLQIALIKGMELGKKVRIDSTATETNIHQPSDSSLLNDSVRVMVQLLKSAKNLLPKIHFCNRLRRAKKLAQFIPTAKEKRRNAYYRDLVKIAEEELDYLQQAREQIIFSNVGVLDVEAWLACANYFEPLIKGIIDQTKRRVFCNEKVPAQEKIISLFEPHSDIISKGNRKVVFGHKLNLTTGKSGMILDAVIEEGNPADSDKFLSMLKRQNNIYGCFPEKVATDGGYASQDNLKAAKALGVKAVVFHKKRGIKIEEMVKSKWIYRQLKNFRAGIEANISCLKRAYGLTRCLWRGLNKFKAYVWSSVVAYNFSLLARLILKSP